MFTVDTPHIRGLQRRLRLPVIAAPMFTVSGPDLVIAACKAGVIGAFPTANCRTLDELDQWLRSISQALQPGDAPFCPNLIMKRDNLSAELELLARHRVEMVITSVGSPLPVIEGLHDIGCAVFADVANIQHASKAVAAGVDGLVLLTAGAGGQTGHANPFAFVRAVRAFFDGPIALAGGVGDGTAVYATRTLGCDLVYMGTRFIATAESMAPAAYKNMLIDSDLDDIVLTRAFTNLETNILRPSIVKAGLDPARLPEDWGKEGAAMLRGSGDDAVKRWKDIWSAGHSVSQIDRLDSVAAVVDELIVDYAAAARRARSL